jgi:hypothetical protein
LHVLGEHNQEGVRFFAPHEDDTPRESETRSDQAKPRRRKAPVLRQYPSPNPPKISNP